MRSGLPMKNLLIISYPFPPIPYSGTYRILRLCKGLDTLGLKVHVLTINIDSKIPNDFELIDRLPKSTMVHRTAIPDPWLWFQTWNNMKKRKGIISKGFTKVFRIFLRVLTIPDHQILWVPFAVRKGAEIVRKFDVGTILVTAPPYSTLLCGSLLKKLKKVRFITDLRDPIVGNIAQVDLLKPKGVYSKFMRKVHETLESHIMKKADVVITNTSTHEKELKKKYGYPIIVTVRNSYDPDDYLSFTKKNFKKYTIAHMGSIYGRRKVDLLFEAIKHIERRSPEKAANLQVIFVGAVSNETKMASKTYEVQPYVKFIGRVPHRRAIEMMMSANLLLLVKATGENSLGQIPAKFFEYLGTGNPILCIGPAQSEVAHLIKRFKLGYVVEKRPSLLAELIDSLMLNEHTHSSIPENREGVLEFDSLSMSKKIGHLIRPLQMSRASATNNAKDMGNTC